MDYKRFLQNLPKTYESFGRPSMRPKDNLFERLSQKFNGLTTANILQLLNLAVSYLEPNEVYCEIGCSQGVNLVGSLYYHPTQMAYAVDRFHDYKSRQENLNKLLENLQDFDLNHRVLFCDREFEDFFKDLQDVNPEEKIGVYFYNGAQDYRSQLMALLLAIPFLSDRALIIVGHSQNSFVQQSIQDFLDSHSSCNLVFNFASIGEEICILSWDVNCHDTSMKAKYLLDQNRAAIQAISDLPQTPKQKDLEVLYSSALELQLLNQHQEAIKKYLKLLTLDRKFIKVRLKLCEIYYLTEEFQKLVDTVRQGLELDAENSDFYYMLGLGLEKLGQFSEAIDSYHQAIELNPNAIDAYHNLGNLLTELNQWEQAKLTYLQAISINSSHFGGYLNLGNLLMKQQQDDDAIRTYQQGLENHPKHPDLLYNLGVGFQKKQQPELAAFYFGSSFYYQKQYSEAIPYYQTAITQQPQNISLYIALADCYRNINLHETGIQILEQALQLDPKSEELYFYLISALQISGRIEEAIATSERAIRCLSSALSLQLENPRILPVIYHKAEEISFYRKRFTHNLDQITRQIVLDTDEAKKSALVGVSRFTNFYLNYQGQNDLELQIKYGNLLHHIMSANYPQWSQPLSIPPLTNTGKIKVGYVSSCMRNHSATKTTLGWLRHSNHQQFELYCYYTDSPTDLFTQLFELHSDVFHHIPNNLERVCQQILEDRLHILMFPDIGMHPLTMQIAALRLAPIQCCRWVHPITTGLLTMDYFVSNELMEPENAEEHYSEKLIRLPNIGISYAKPLLPELTKTRADFHLQENSIVYLCCQSLFKYLPQHDYLWAEIARQVPQAQFVFLAHRSQPITEIFQHRLHQTFDAVGLNWQDYCVVLPRQNQFDYWQLNLLADIYLDNWSWSGCNTTMEAIACGLPIVIYPGELMRSRHSYGILKMLGVTDTIAESEVEYIQIAVQLALKPQWREEITQRIIQRHSRVYDDTSCVAALEAFYENVVQ